MESVKGAVKALTTSIVWIIDRSLIFKFLFSLSDICKIFAYFAYLYQAIAEKKTCWRYPFIETFQKHLKRLNIIVTSNEILIEQDRQAIKALLILCRAEELTLAAQKVLQK